MIKEVSFLCIFSFKIPGKLLFVPHLEAAFSCKRFKVMRELMKQSFPQLFADTLFRSIREHPCKRPVIYLYETAHHPAPLIFTEYPEVIVQRIRAGFFFRKKEYPAVQTIIEFRRKALRYFIKKFLSLLYAYHPALPPLDQSHSYAFIKKEQGWKISPVLMIRSYHWFTVTPCATS